MCGSALISIMLISCRKTQRQWVLKIDSLAQMQCPFRCCSLALLDTMLQLSPVLIKAQQCDWEAFLATGSIFPPEIEQSFRAGLQTHCRYFTNWQSFSFVTTSWLSFFNHLTKEPYKSLKYAHTIFSLCFMHRHVCCRNASSAVCKHQGESSIDSQLHFGLSLFVVDFGSAHKL